ncbi:putative CCAAT/enhancer-binding protein gamma-like [Apostichopus japonicus]|uniref:Putative CCAAT/enhancer-binding protein gamma-like n=2 Tax=Stichopus japonicus TaxID=307972 RepID=A0A2G8KC29_STIJA|nr:putative CCAAT/enhancer-binding protein gamma-like [Apostichopus japonicus]
MERRLHPSSEVHTTSQINPLLAMATALVPILPKAHEPGDDMSVTSDAEGSLEEVKTTGGGKMGRSQKKYLHDKDSEEYKKRRERNNVAVRKSRDKSRWKTQQTLDKINELKAENSKLEGKVSLLSKELSVLKDLFLSHAEELPDPSTTFGLFNSGASSKLVAEPTVIENSGSKLIVANTIELSVDGENVSTILGESNDTIEILPVQAAHVLSTLSQVAQQVILSESSG